MNHISWNTTKRCNLYCKHCYRDSGPEEMDDELSTEEGKKLMDQMVKAGMNIIVLSGGEPMTREDIFELVSYAKSIGITILMGSNGTLITKEKALKLKECGLSAIAISIDSLDPEKHNNFKGSNTAFEKAIEGATNYIDAGIRVQINCTITKDNIDEIEKIADFAADLGAISSHMLFLVDTGRGKNIKEISIEKEEYKKALHRIIDKDNELNISVRPTCAPQFKVESLLRGIETKSKTRGCRARAYSSTGDWLEEDPYCLIK